VAQETQVVVQELEELDARMAGAEKWETVVFGSHGLTGVMMLFRVGLIKGRRCRQSPEGTSGPGYWQTR
jgi:hypothetical protein